MLSNLELYLVGGELARILIGDWMKKRARGFRLSSGRTTTEDDVLRVFSVLSVYSASASIARVAKKINDLVDGWFLPVYFPTYLTNITKKKCEFFFLLFLLVFTSSLMEPCTTQCICTKHRKRISIFKNILQFWVCLLGLKKN